MRSVRDLMDLKDRVALITGGAGHIGSAIAEALAELGASIAVVDKAEDRCEEVTLGTRQRYGVHTLPIVVDMADTGAVRVVPDIVFDNFGRLDILVNCAALVGTQDLPGWTSSFERQSVETWRAALEINLTATFVLVQACVRTLKASGHGSIVNICSTYAVVGPDWRLYEGSTMGSPAAYAASKGGLLQLTRWLATTLAPEIRVNAISPGGVYRNQSETFLSRYVGRTPLGRLATEEDFKGAIAYLASDLSGYVTGHNLMVDGGWTAW